jgi:hypothetical protein
MRPSALRWRVVEALDAERQAIDAGGAKAGEAAASTVPGLASSVISAPGDSMASARKAASRRVDGRRRQQAGRAAAEEDADHRPAPDQRQRGLQIGDQRIATYSRSGMPPRLRAS